MENKLVVNVIPKKLSSFQKTFTQCHCLYDYCMSVMQCALYNVTRAAIVARLRMVQAS